MFKGYTDVLIESYIIEAYISKAAPDEPTRSAAERNYKNELTNGEKQLVSFGAKSYYQNVGSFDLDNFHIAFDKYFEDNGLLNLFGNDGKLLNKATYGTIKNLDRTAPAVKALFKL